MQTAAQIKDAVKEAYGNIAEQATPKNEKGGGCCGASTLQTEYAKLDGHYEARNTLQHSEVKAVSIGVFGRKPKE